MTRQHIPYRSRTTITAIILEIVKRYEPEGILRTRLMMEANVSNMQLHTYLQEMLYNQLIACDSSKAKHVAASSRRGTSKVGDRFHITSKGEKYLQMTELMKEIIPGVKV